MNKRMPSHRRLPHADEWDRQWQDHWSKVGLPGYELPVGGPMEEDREFLAQDEIGFGRITDSPTEAVDLIARGLPPAVKARLRPACAGS